MCWLEFVMRWIEAVYAKPAEVERQEREKQSTATDALPEPPPMFRAEPAVKEAQLVIQGKSISSVIPGRVARWEWSGFDWVPGGEP